MENTKKIKLFIGLSYLLIICVFLYFFFSKFSLSEITSYDFLRDNQSYFFELKKSNLFLISIIFLALKVINFFFATLIGIIPQIFLAVSIGSGLEKIIDQNAEVPGITDIIFSPDIYVPISAFFILILITIFLRKFFYRN